MILQYTNIYKTGAFSWFVQNTSILAGIIENTCVMYSGLFHLKHGEGVGGWRKQELRF